ncbi:MAG TPA: hypothetical protein VFP80_08570, partial [Thermoanaerobaculia bacterium]|nr:hypothetical protein [Thermoanaerobaculia bacterium]
RTAGRSAGEEKEEEKARANLHASVHTESMPDRERWRGGRFLNDGTKGLGHDQVLVVSDQVLVVSD